MTAAASTAIAIPRERSRSLAMRAVFLAMALPLSWDVISEYAYLVRVALWPNAGAAYRFLNSGALSLLVFTAIMAILSFALLPRVSVRPGQVLVIGFGFFLLALGLCSAFAHGVPVLKPFLAHISYWMTMFFGFVVAFSTPFDDGGVARLERFLARFSVLLLFGSASGFLVLELYRRTSGGLYIGYPADQLLLPLAYYGTRRKWILVAGTVLLIVLTGKRGPMLAAAVMLFYMLSRGRVLRSLVLLLAIGLVVPLVPAGVNYVREKELVSEDSSLGRTLRKWTMTVERTRGDDLTTASSGRDIEIRESLTLIQTPLDVAIGRGFGWFFYYPDDPQPAHFAHLSYLNYFITYGLVGSLPLFAAMALAWIHMWRTSLQPGAPLFLKVLVPYFYGFLVFALTANFLSVYLVFWILFGIATQVSLRLRPVSI